MISSRSTRREAARAEAVVRVLKAVLAEVSTYVGSLHGERPDVDSRISKVYDLLVQVRTLLRRTPGDPIPSPEGEGRPQVGPDKNWAATVTQTVYNHLVQIRPWRKYEDESEAESAGILSGPGRSSAS